MDSTILQFLAPPFVASLIIAGIHAYLGLHVVERGVIFVDLSLAQIAALGATIAVWQGDDPHDPAIYWISLGVHASSARSIFAMIKGQDAHIPQEAIIGISYAVASAAVILAMSKATRRGRAPEGHARRQHPGGVVARSVADRRALRWRSASSTTSSGSGSSRSRWTPRRSPRRGVSVRFWDFLFYASFGFVVTRRWRSPACCWCSAT